MTKALQRKTKDKPLLYNRILKSGTYPALYLVKKNKNTGVSHSEKIKTTLNLTEPVSKNKNN